MTALPGITGTLFPSRFLIAGVTDSLPPIGDLESRRRRLERWWTTVAESFGPATGVRTLFERVATPLFGSLGFLVRDAALERVQVRAWLETRRSGTPVGLVLLPWAERPSLMWRDAATAARDFGAAWCFVLAPPFLSLVDVRAHATRRALDFTFPGALSVESFRRLWLAASATAFERVGPADQGAARLDALVASALMFQDRVREDLQGGVATALMELGAALPSSPDDAGGEALTLVYRILFLLFAESRRLVPVANPTYGAAYAVGTFCREALDGIRTGLWDALAAVTRLSRAGCRTDDLIVQPFNGRLFARAAAPSLESRKRVRADRRDAAMQHALIALGSRPGRAGREYISYADLGVEQLGAVYERVLDLDTADTARPGRRGAPTPRHSRRRKETGTFYTPQALAEFVVRRTLAPLVDGMPAANILALRVVDPAMGSGAFLVAACRYLAAAYERALVSEGRAAPADMDEDARADIRRLVAERCLAGVDANPVAVQLARLSLWLTTLARDRPLGFLDHRLRAGDSLIGASPDDLRRIRTGRASDQALPLFDDDTVEDALRRAIGPLRELAGRDDTVAAVRNKETVWRRLTADSSPLQPWRLAASLWCARWFWPGEATAPGAAELRATIDALLHGDRMLPSARVAERLSQTTAVARDRRFFHWTLEFADVFYDALGHPKPEGGFDAVIGNPPWEMLRREAPDTATTGAVRDSSRLVRFIRESGLYPSCDRGHVNLYQPFLERALSLTRRGGRVGLVLPWGLATDDGAARLRATLFHRCDVDTIVGLDNAEALFPVHRGLRFMVLVASPGRATKVTRARFGVKTTAELEALPDRDESIDQAAYPARLTPRQLAAIGGTTLRVPDLRRPDDGPWLEHLATTLPSLSDAEGWNATFGRELNATEDRGRLGPTGLPVIEGKHLEPFQTHAGTPAGRIDRPAALRRLPDGRFDRPRLGYRDVAGVGNRLTLIAAIVPAGVVTTHTIFCLRTPMPIDRQHLLCALMNSYVLNTVVRLLMGSHLTTSLVEQLPAPPPRGTRRERRITALARRIARGHGRQVHHAILQAEVARLYDLNEATFRRVLEACPLVPASDRSAALRAFQRSRG